MPFADLAKEYSKSPLSAMTRDLGCTVLFIPAF